MTTTPPLAPLTPDELDHWAWLIDEYRQHEADTDDLPFCEFLDHAIADLRAYRTALRRIAESAPSSPEGRADWQVARRVLGGAS